MITNGIDMVYIERIQELLKNPKVLKKMFSDRELKQFQQKGTIIESIAGAFASKEAFGKAMHYHMGNFSFCEVEVQHADDHSPYFVFSGELKEKTKGKQFSLSISHEQEYAIAIVTCYSPSS